MSVYISASCWQLTLPPIDKLVLLSLADQANDNGECWPSVGSIAMRTGLSERGVYLSLSRLKKIGYVVVKERPGHSSVYHLPVPTPAPRAPLHHVHPHTPAPRSGTPARSSPPPLHHVHPESSFESIKKRNTSRDNVPFSRIVELYHEMLPELPKVVKLTAARQSAIRARWRGKDAEDLGEWREYFAYVRKSKFLMGLTAPNKDHHSWRADLEWLCKEANFVKVLEGKFHG